MLKGDCNLLRTIFLFMIFICGGCKSAININDLHYADRLYCTADGLPYSGTAVSGEIKTFGGASTGEYCVKNYTNGKLDGESSIYSMDGKLVDRSYYRNGELNGSVQAWHRNGSKASESFYVDGVQWGDYREWHDNNQLAVSCRYVNDKPEGIYEKFYNNGCLAYKATYVNGQLDGLVFSWDFQANPVSKSLYRNGICLEEEFYWNDAWHKGVFKESKPWSGEFKQAFEWGTFIDDDTFGSLKAVSIIHYQEGVKSGEGIFLDNNGNELCRGVYLNDKEWSGKFASQVDGYCVFALRSYEEGGMSGVTDYYISDLAQIKLGKRAVSYPVKYYESGYYKEGLAWTGVFFEKTPSYCLYVRWYSHGRLMREDSYSTISYEYAYALLHRQLLHEKSEHRD